jgi:hypothetical protein
MRKTREEVVAELADRKYHSYMGGDHWPRSGVSEEFVAWMLGVDPDLLDHLVEDQFRAILKQRNGG